MKAEFWRNSPEPYAVSQHSPHGLLHYRAESRLNMRRGRRTGVFVWYNAMAESFNAQLKNERVPAPPTHTSSTRFCNLNTPLRDILRSTVASAAYIVSLSMDYRGSCPGPCPWMSMGAPASENQTLGPSRSAGSRTPIPLRVGRRSVERESRRVRTHHAPPSIRGDQTSPSALIPASAWWLRLELWR